MRKLGYLILLAAIVFGVGLLMNWWSITSVEAADGKKGYGVELSDGTKKNLSKLKDKAGDVVDKVKDKVSGAKEAAPSIAGIGEIAKVDADAGTVQLTMDGKALPVTIEVAKATLTLNGAEAEIEELRVGDKVEVTMNGETPSLIVTR